MYVYGSRDESPKYYCSWDHWVLSSPDLRTWEIAKDAFASSAIPGGGDGKAWTTITAPVKNPSGVHALWLRFSGEGPDLLRIDSLQFGPDRR